MAAPATRIPKTIGARSANGDRAARGGFMAGACQSSRYVGANTSPMPRGFQGDGEICEQNSLIRSYVTAQVPKKVVAVDNGPIFAAPRLGRGWTRYAS
jgi:hypothetical protein